jgi:Calcineurin-like phosphoesterase
MSNEQLIVTRRQIKDSAARVKRGGSSLKLKTIETAIRKKVRSETAIYQKIQEMNQKGQFAMLTYSGVIPVDLPDGTMVTIIPDLHVPAQDERAWALLIMYLEKLKEHCRKTKTELIVIAIGDVIDVYALGAWIADPQVKKDLNKEVEVAGRRLREIIEASGCIHLYVILGNHEDRAKRAIMNNYPELAHIEDFDSKEPILALHRLAGFKSKHRVTFIGDMMDRGGFGGGVNINNDVMNLHGHIVAPQPGTSARKTAEHLWMSSNTGHTHRTGFQVWQTTKGTKRAYEGGWLGDERRGEVGYANILNNWFKSIVKGQIVNGKLLQTILPIKKAKVAGKMRYCMLLWGELLVAPDC